MIFYTPASTSMAVEREVLSKLESRLCRRDPAEARGNSLPNENLYEITVTVRQVEEEKKDGTK